MRTTFTKHSAYVASLALVLPFGLAACGGDGGKPSKEEVIDGIQSFMDEQFDEMGMGPEDFERLGVTDEAWDDFYTCIVDGIYDEVSDDTLRAMVKGDTQADLPSEDGITFSNQVVECQPGLLGN